MSDGRQKTQMSMSFSTGRRSEAPSPIAKASESIIAECHPESPTGTRRLMEAVCEPKNLNEYVQIALSNSYLYSIGVIPLASFVKV
jgi:hypothetical protein